MKDDLALPIDKLGDWGDISPHFTQQEIFSPDTMGKLWLVDYEALLKINRFRSSLNRTLLINHNGLTLRGVRSAAEQMNLVKQGLTSALSSMHPAGKAFDITCPDKSVEWLAAAALEFSWHCVGAYPKKNFVHVDMRSLEMIGKQFTYEQ